MSEQWQVGRGKVVARELDRGGPRERDMLVWSRRRAARGEAAEKWNHLDHHRAIVVREAWQRPQVGKRAAQFFADLAMEGAFRRLAGLHLAARKLPFQAQMLVRGALGEQQVTCLILKEGANDGERWTGGHGAVVRERMGRAVRFLQLCAASWVFPGMKTFLKVLCLVVLAVIAIKLLPATIGLAFLVGAALVALVAAGVSVLAGVALAGVILAAVLAPVWVPVALLVGFIMLVRRVLRKPAPVAAATA